MDELIADQIEWLLSNCGSSNRLGRQLIALIGFLGSAEMPESIQKQSAALSKLVVQQDLFDSLIQSLNTISKQSVSLRIDTKPGEQVASHEPTKLLEQIESIRCEIGGIDTVNYPEVISWIVGEAKKQKILKSKGRR